MMMMTMMMMTMTMMMMTMTCGRLTLRCLRGDKCLNERVGGLRVQREGAGKRQQFWTAVEVAVSKSVSAGMKELANKIETSFEHRALARRHVHRQNLLRFALNILYTRPIIYYAFRTCFISSHTNSLQHLHMTPVAD